MSADSSPADECVVVIIRPNKILQYRCPKALLKKLPCVSPPVYELFTNISNINVLPSDFSRLQCPKCSAAGSKPLVTWRGTQTKQIRSAKV